MHYIFVSFCNNIYTEGGRFFGKVHTQIQLVSKPIVWMINLMAEYHAGRRQIYDFMKTIRLNTVTEVPTNIVKQK